MKTVFSLTLLVLFLDAIPGQAQIVRRPLVRKFIQSPFVHEVVNFGIHQFLPGFPALPNLAQDNSGALQDSSAILVDGSVIGNLARIETNLSDANDIMKDLLGKYKTTATNKDDSKKDDSKKDDSKKDDSKKDGKVAPKVGASGSDSKIVELAKELANETNEKTRALLQRQMLLEVQNADEIKKKADEFQAHMKKGIQAFQGGSFADSVAAFRQALNLNAEDPGAQQGLAAASSALQTDDFTKALKALTEEFRNFNKAEIKLKPITSTKEIPTKGQTPITVELVEAAPLDLNLKASASVGANMLTGSGMIEKGKNSVDMTITTDNIPDTLTELTIEIAATAFTKAASMKIPIKVKTN